jgi:hypothetical protein
MRYLFAVVLMFAAVSSSRETEAQVGQNFRSSVTVRQPAGAVRIRRSPSLEAASRFNFGWDFGAAFVLPPDLFYRPFSWAAPIYPAPIVPAPIYLAPLYTPSPYLSLRQTKSIPVDQVEELSRRLGRLTEEIQRMQEGRPTPQTAPEPAPSLETTALPTILVFRDGRQMEIQDYAIADQTLWVFMERGSTKIPIADLDLEATTNINAGRGVRFTPPR